MTVFNEDRTTATCHPSHAFGAAKNVPDILWHFPRPWGSQQGFSLVMAIFILLILGLLGSYMTRFTGVQQATFSGVLQGARAFQAAKSGLGWAVARIDGGGSCAEVNAQTAFTLPNISGFSVALSCSSTRYTEGDKTVVVYSLSALSQFGVFSSSDYVARKLEMSMVE